MVEPGWLPSTGSSRSPVTVEEEYFPPPPELRELLRGLESALCLLNGVPARADGRRRGRRGTVGTVLADDRTTVAADVLEQLAG